MGHAQILCYSLSSRSDLRKISSTRQADWLGWQQEMTLISKWSLFRFSVGWPVSHMNNGLRYTKPTDTRD
ncbi:unnamed protein product [Absidia cylindrospora]